MRLRFFPMTCAVAAVVAAAPAVLSQEPAAAPAQRVVPMARYTIGAGDFNGDGFSETAVYDTETKALRIIDYSGQGPIQTMGIFVTDTVSKIVGADLDGDGKDELITGEGLGGYNPKEGPQTDATVKIYTPSAKGDWSPVEIYRKASERPDVTSLRVKDVDGDGKKDILFSYMASKYMADVRVAKRSGDKWVVTELPQVRMGMHVDAGDVLHNGKPMIVVGRPYGDPKDPEQTTAIGDAFILDGARRIALPVTRGVSAVAVGNVDGRKGDEIVIADGWHSNYGKLARSRIALLSRKGKEWNYELIEDLNDHMRFEQVEIVDLNADGTPEIVGRAAQNGTLGGSVRVYQRGENGWRGMTAAQLVQSYASGDFNSDKTRELVFAGQPPLPFSLAAQGPAWETSLGEEVVTREVDPKSLIDKPAPPVLATEWLGSEPQTIESLKGKVVLLDFWATWCKPCIEMYPEMRTWVKEFAPQGLVILGITNRSMQTSAQVKRFFERHKLPWPVAIDPKNRTHIEYGVSPIPHTFLIDRNGVLRMSHRGGGDLSEIEAMIRKLLSEKPEGAE